MMRKFFSTGVFLVAIGVFLLYPQQIEAAEGLCSEEISNFSYSGWPSEDELTEDASLAPQAINFFSLRPNSNYIFKCQDDRPALTQDGPKNVWRDLTSPMPFSTNASGNGTLIINNNGCWSKKDDDLRLILERVGGDACRIKKYKVGSKSGSYRCEIAEYYVEVGGEEVSGCLEKGEILHYRYRIMYGDDPYSNSFVWHGAGSGNTNVDFDRHSTDANGYFSGTLRLKDNSPVIFWLSAEEYGNRDENVLHDTNVIPGCNLRTGQIYNSGECTDEERENGAEPDPNSGSGDSNFYLCRQIPDDSGLRGECETCLDEVNGYKGIWTAVGCIRTDASSIVQAIMTISLSIAGGVTLLMFLAASFMLSVSQGEPKRTSEAKEMVTSAVIGLLFIVFSITILQFIGVDILRIPGFGG